MKEEAKQIIAGLKVQVQEMINQVHQFQKLDEETLNQNPTPDGWSVLECIAHLNLYSDFYINEFENRITRSSHPASQFHSATWFGKICFGNMLPKNNTAPKPMSTFKKMNPIYSDVDHLELSKFLKQQQYFLNVLDMAEKVSLSKTKCNITLPLLKLNLGDTLKFYTYHNVRHIWQAQNVLRVLKGTNKQLA